jgi:hypothetical protein
MGNKCNCALSRDPKSRESRTMETPPPVDFLTSNTREREHTRQSRQSPLPAESPEVSELLPEIAMEDMVDMEEYEYV